MGWARLDDRFFAHPKVIGVSLAARGLWVTALSWAAFLKTDGKIPTGIVASWVTEDPDPLVEELVAARLWEPVMTGGYQVHDFLEWNPSREMREAQREATNARAAAYRQRHAHITRDVAKSNGQVTRDDESASRCSPALPCPAPSQKDLEKPVVVSKGVRGKRRAERACTLPDDFAFTEERRKFAEAGGVPDPALEFAQFKDHHRSRGSLMYDWEAAWKTWCRNTIKFATQRHSR